VSVDNDPPRRRYRQTRRAESRAQTRARIRESARTLLLDRGYAGTSMRAVAEHAGVGVRTVYDYFPTKTELLKEVVQTAIVGDSLPIPARGRSWFQAVLDEADPTRRAALLAHASTQLHQRTAALFTVARSAAADDPDAAALWRGGKAGHRNDCERFARAILGENNTAAVRTLTATLYVLIGPETYTLLADELGFTPASYERWLRHQLAAVFEHAGKSLPRP
jgi:AcrR family transcriptional regulator